MNTKSRLKSILTFLSSVLTLLKWVPFLGKYRTIVIALSTVVGTLLGVVDRCSTDDQQPTRKEPKTIPPTPESTPTHIPTPSPTPTPMIVIEGKPQVGQKFTVRYTAPFQYNTHLWVGKYRLQIMGKEVDTNYLIANAITLNTAGARTLFVKTASGDILAEKTITVTE